MDRAGATISASTARTRTWRPAFGSDRFGMQAEAFARFFGTPRFLIVQTFVVAAWIVVNAFGLVAFDLYPFILLNLAFSTQAAYAAPLILLAQTRQADRDKVHAEADAMHREDIAAASTTWQQMMSEQNARISPCWSRTRASRRCPGAERAHREADAGDPPDDRASVTGAAATGRRRHRLHTDPMRPPARRLAPLRESTIREMTRLALEHDAVNLAQGFPDFPPPPEVIAAAHAAIDAGHNQYAMTWGIKPLRDALSTMLGERYGLEYDPERHVVITCGVTEAITAALLAAVDPGGEVVIVEPFHENYLPAATFAGADAVFHALRPPHHALDPDELRRASPAGRARS